MSLKSQIEEGISPTLLTQLDVAQILGVSLKWVQIQRREGKLKYLRFGHRTIRIPMSEVERLFNKAATGKRS